MTRITVLKLDTLSGLVLDFENDYQARDAMVSLSHAKGLETVTIKFNHVTPMEQPANA